MFRSIRQASVEVNSTIINRWESGENVTITTPFQIADGNKRGVPVVGYPGPLFTAIHVSALVTLSVSTLVLIGLFLHLCGCRRLIARGPGRIVRNNTSHSEGSSTSGIHSRRGADTRSTDADIDRKAEERGKNQSDDKNSSVRSAVANANQRHDSQNTRDIRSFWKWNAGERLVVYLGICDLCQGVSHFLDHAYMLYAKDNPPPLVCAVFGFFLHEFTVSQWIVVASTAVSACSLVVFGRKLPLGRWDWRLIVVAYGLPAVVGAVGIPFEMLGPSGAWCFVNLGTRAGLAYNQVITVSQVTLYVVVALAYGAIWFKINRTAKLLTTTGEPTATDRYRSSARVMLIFVAVFILQWWSLTLFNVWTLIAGGPAPPAVLVLAVVLINLGGVYNCLAYTVVRRRLQRQARKANARRRAMINNKCRSGERETEAREGRAGGGAEGTGVAGVGKAGGEVDGSRVLVSYNDQGTGVSTSLEEFGHDTDAQCFEIHI